MSVDLIIIERKITEFWTNVVKTLLFFITGNQQSLFVSAIHYIIFVVGLYYFFFKSEPGDLFRILFFLIILISLLSYFIFNKCFFTSIELSLSSEKNPIQSFMDTYFGKEIEGNITSKIVLSIMTAVTGFVLLKDYGFITYGT
jgi:hypothetical protein